MRILSFATTYPRHPGDSEPSFVHDLNRHLVALGHEVHALVPHGAGLPLDERMEGVHIRRFRYAPEAFERLFYRGGVMAALQASWAARATLPAAVVALWASIRRGIQEIRPDLVHAHWLVPAGLLARNPTARQGIPLVVTAHGADVHQLGRGPLRALVARAAHRADALTANTASTAAAVETIDGPRSLDVIPMGIDLEVFGPERRDPALASRLGATRPWILGVGRLVEKKGFEHLIRAFPAVLEHHPEATLTVVGHGPLRAPLQRQAERSSASGRIRFLGPRDRGDVAVLMASADVFVAPSVRDRFGDTEGQGVVLAEAMASGCPVVGTRVGGVSDAVDDRCDGLLVEPGLAGALADAILQTLAKPEETRRRVDAALRRARRYDWRVVAADFDSLFRRLVGAPERSAVMT